MSFEESRMTMDPEPKVTEDVQQTKRIRYVFTIVCRPVELPDNPLVTKVWLDERMRKLEGIFPDARAGIVAVMED